MKNCPFCGSMPVLECDPMWNGSHGYHGAFGFYVHCTNITCTVKPSTIKYDTIYNDNKAEQMQRAIDAWGNRSE